MRSAPVVRCGVWVGVAMAAGETVLIYARRGQSVFYPGRTIDILGLELVRDATNRPQAWLPPGLDRLFAPSLSEYGIIALSLVVVYGLTSVVVAAAAYGSVLWGRSLRPSLFRSLPPADFVTWSAVITFWLLAMHKVGAYDFFQLMPRDVKGVFFIAEAVVLVWLLSHGIARLAQRGDASPPPRSKRKTVFGQTVVAASMFASGGVFLMGWVPLPAAGAPGSAHGPHAATRRVVLISVDTLRADHLPMYGYSRPTAPHLTAFAQESIVFEQCISPSSWTLPAMMSTMTSLPPHAHRVEDDGAYPAAAVTTLAREFHRAGFQTAAFVSHYYVSSAFGFDRGFDTFEEFGQATQIPMSNPTAAEMTQRIAPWITDHQNEPFFLYIHYFDPHWDYVPPPEFHAPFRTGYSGPVSGRNFWKTFLAFRSPDVRLPRGARDHIVSLYDGEILYWDHWWGRLRSHLEELGLWDTSVVVVMGDHGEEFEDHGSLGHFHSLYEELLHVPLIVHLPETSRTTPRRARYPGLVSSLDVAPTLLDLAAVPIPEQFAGTSLALLLEGEMRPDPVVVSSSIHLGTDKIAVRTTDWKLIHTYTPDLIQFELFNLANDPDEHRNVVKDHPDTFRELQQRLFADVMAASRRGLRNYRGGATEDTTLTREQEEHLRSLGYVN